MNIINDLIPKSKYGLKCPYAMDPEFIVIHNAANDASAAAEIKYMRDNSFSASFHFAVDDAEVRQAIPLDRNAWHAGDGTNGKGNRKGIAIEICYSYCKKQVNGKWIADEEKWVKNYKERFLKAEENAARFTAELLKERGWGIDRVKKHQDFSGKRCPHRTLDLGWERFKKMVEGFMDLTTVNDIVWELSAKGIISDKDLWLKKLKEDENTYWLARKCVNYIRNH